MAQNTVKVEPDFTVVSLANVKSETAGEVAAPYDHQELLLERQQLHRELQVERQRRQQLEQERQQLRQELQLERQLRQEFQQERQRLRHDRQKLQQERQKLRQELHLERQLRQEAGIE